MKTKHKTKIPPKPPITDPELSETSSVRTLAPTPEVQTRIVDVSPEKARKWLEKNHPDNRPINPGRVQSFANDMRDGNWKLTHQGVAFDAEGRLIDGQHRLSAIIEADIAVRLMVTHNLGNFGDPIDCGRPRSVATLAGQSGRVVAVVNCLRLLEQGFHDTRPMTLAEYHEVHAHHEHSIAAVATIPKHAKIVSGMTAAYVYAHPIAPEAVLMFASQINTGEMLERGSPAFALFNWKDRNKGMSSWDVALATLSAIRHHLAGEKLASVYAAAPTGYRLITGKRRAMRIPYTPATSLVPSGPALTNKRPDKTAGTPVPEVASSLRPTMTFDDGE